MDCPQCKAQVSDDAVFCQECGARVAVPEEGAATTQSPQVVMGTQAPSGGQRRAGYCEVCGQELGVNEKLRGLTVHERCPSPVGETPVQAMGQLPSQGKPTEAISHEERLERLSRIVSTRTLEGWSVVDRNEQDVWAVLALPEKPVNHVLHAIISIFSCGAWALVWLIIALMHRNEQRVRISIDGYGNLLEEKVTIR